MAIQAGFSQVAAALADPAREAILVALADGRALPAGELAALAGVSPQSASAHLQKLIDCRILAVWPQGKFRYYRLAGDKAAEVVEALANFTRGLPSGRQRKQPAPPDLAFARCCYSHLAGSLGIRLAELLTRRGYIRIAGDRVETTTPGAEWAVGNGFLPTSGSAGSKRAASPDFRLCLDWTERRHHLAGRVPTAILRHLLESGHLRRGVERVLHLNISGKAWFDALDEPLPAPPATRKKM
jgi:DNA-binding transcriptional ArsR family regulator